MPSMNQESQETHTHPPGFGSTHIPYDLNVEGLRVTLAMYPHGLIQPTTTISQDPQDQQFSLFGLPRDYTLPLINENSTTIDSQTLTAKNVSMPQRSVRVLKHYLSITRPLISCHTDFLLVMSIHFQLYL